MAIYNNASEVWLAINLANSQEDILSVLADANDSNIKLDSNDLKNLALSQSVDAGGAKVAVLYAGNIPQYNSDGSPIIGSDGKQVVIHSSEYAKTTAGSSNGAIAVIDNTEASKFVGEQSFKRAIELSFDDNEAAYNQFFNGTTDSNGVRTSHGLNGEISVKFVTENNFEQAITFSHNASSDSILFSKEIPTLLEKEGFQSVDGLEKSYLNSLKEATGNFDDVISDVKSSSGAHFGLLETGKDADGALLLGTKKLLENVEGVNGVDLPAEALDIKSGATILGKDLSWVGDHLPSKAVLAKLGVAGDILSLSFAVKEAKAAEDAGDLVKSHSVMEGWAAEFLGGIAGGAVAVGVVVALVPVSTVGGIVAGALALAAGITGGVYGGEAGQYLLEKAKELGLYDSEASGEFQEAAKDFFENLLADASTIGGALQSAYQSFLNTVAASIPPKDPLIIDTKGDGLSLSSWQNSNVRFDLTGDGVTESTGWTTPSSANINYNAGSGSIIINQESANLIDQIVLGSGIAKENITFSQVAVWNNSQENPLNYNLVINFNDPNHPEDKITILNYFRYPTYVFENGTGTQVQIEPFKINGLQFSDGSSFNFSDLKYQVNGTEGNDSLFDAGWGIDNSPTTLINAGAGDDRIYGKNITANGGDGDDYFQLHGGDNKISGGAGDDTIYSNGPTSGITEVYSGDGNDQINIEGGSSFVSSGRGNDTINLYDSRDGGVAGNNIVFSGSGADNIYLGSGSDSINAGSGDDSIYAGQGNNQLTGGSGADFFNFYINPEDAASTDVITDFELGAGDRIGFDFWPAKSFAELNIYQDGNNAVIEVFNKKIVLENVNSLELNEGHFNGLAKVTADHGGKLDDVIGNDWEGSQNVFGGAGNDKLFVSYQAVNGQAFGEEGNDELTANSLAQLDGGQGDDTLATSGSGNILTGGLGSDKFVFGQMWQNVDNLITDFDVNNLGEKIILSGVSNTSFDDLLIADSEAGAVVTYSAVDQYSGETYVGKITLAGVLASQLSANNFEVRSVLLGTSSNDVITSSDNNGHYVYANGGDDLITLGGGDDFIGAYAQGDKTITSGAGNDWISSQYGAANINAEDGNDSIYYGSGDLAQGEGFELRGGEGDDIIDSYSYSSFDANNDRKILGEGGDDSINIQWGEQLQISGGAGDDFISGQARFSTISGDEGNDEIELGSSNNDNTVFGGVGNDAIIMQSGSNNNQISGGEGDDLFVVRESIWGSTGELSSNTITDFEVNNLNEKIDFQFRNIEKFEDLLISQKGSDAVITFGPEAKTLILTNVDAAQLTAQNFNFKTVGTSANDEINASNRFNNVDGGAGNDIISAIGQENKISGGAGNDIFVVQKNANSTTVINDFATANSYEKIQLKGFGDISFADVLVTYQQKHEFVGDVRTYTAYINFGDGQSLEIRNVADKSLTADKFLFADLTAEELETFNNSVEPEPEVKEVDKIEAVADDESNNKIYEATQDTVYIQKVEGIQTSAPVGTVISVTPEINDDVFLVLDKNNNGNVDDVTELFGNDVRSGFEELRKYDSNADNIINSADSQFDLLKFWNDANADAKVDAGEMVSLTDSGVEEISLRAINSNTSIAGNLIARTAEIKFTDGHVGVVNEVFFGLNNFNSSISNPDEALGPDFVLNIDALVLPYSRGYSSLNSWQVAMSLNSELLETAQTLNDLQPNEFYKINSLFEKFLYQWAGLENVDSTDVYTSAGGNKISVNKIAFLESVTSLDFRSATDAGVLQAQQSWNLFYNEFLARFLTQGTFREIFPDAAYDFATDVTKLNLTLDQAISNILSLSGDLDSNSFLNYAYYSKNILQLNRGQFTDADFDAKVNNMINSVVNSVTISGFNFNGVFNVGDNSNETLFGSDNSDIVKGEEGDDDIYAGTGNDYIEGGKGNDYLKGEDGNDIYKFNVGDGKDVIDETSGTDKIIFGSGITQASLTFVQVGNDLVINVGVDGDQIGIKNFYSSSQNKIESIELADGSKIDLANLGSIIYGSVLDDVISGSVGNDIIAGLEGNDTINAGSGDDTITGGKGNDVITDDAGGNDIYIFNLGDGQDVITDYNGSDKIIFGTGIAKEDITLIPNVTDSNSLVVKIGNSGDQITLQNFFSSWDNYSKIEALQFADGSTIDLGNGLTLQGTSVVGETLRGTYFADNITGNIGNDSISAGYGNDTITGGKGNDVITDDAGGNDIYIFNLGDGQDVITDYNGSDKIIFGTGIAKEDITLIPNVTDSNSLVVKIGTNGDQITLQNFFLYYDNYTKIETLQFADGSTIDLGNGLTLQGANVAGETLRGTSSSDNIAGNIGNDSISAGYGDDTVTGGKGNDTITDDAGGNDIYIFNLGDGQDVITDFSGSDKIIFGTGIVKEDITLIPNVTDSNSLVVKIGTNGDQITLKNFFLDFSNYSKIETLQFADGSTIDLGNGLTLQGANTAGESLQGTSFTDNITGNIGNDAINAGSGDDTVTGGQGNDTITDTFGGNDIYIFNLGDGQDVITDYNGSDKIIFGTGIAKEDITLIPSISNSNSLIIKIGNSGDQITLQNFFSSWDNYSKIEALQFADGSTIDLGNGLTLQGTNVAGETLRGTYFADNITGNIGNDSINAGYGNDTITGGKGNDVITDDAGGNDTYIFNLGDGQDVITDYNGSDKIIFGAGIAKEDISLISSVTNSNSLIIKIGNSGDQITLQNFFSSWDNYSKIEALQFADGSTIDLGNGLTLQGTNVVGETLRGTSSSDNITGNIGNDSINAGYGDDTITGGKGNDTITDDVGGNDTYIFNLGDGQDIITDYNGDDTMLFGEGISPEDILMQSAGTDLVIKIGGLDDQVTIKNFFSGSQIENLKFADGTLVKISDGIDISGSSSNDQIVGTPFVDNLQGGAGEDYLYTGDGDDSLDGGTGNDNLRGGGGSDTYLFSANYGNDLVYDDGGSADTILFGADINSSTISAARSGNNLVISKQGAADIITVVNFFTAEFSRIEYVQFDGGEKFNLAGILNNTSAASYSFNGYAAVNEDMPTTIKLFNLQSDAGDYLTISSFGEASNGVVSLNEFGEIIYTSNANFNGSDSFEVSYFDSEGVEQTKVINVDVLAANDAPTAINFNLQSNEDSVVEINPLLNASDIDGDTLSISSVANPTHGSVRIEGGKIIYTPTANFNGSDSFKYTVSDNRGGADTKEIFLNVLAVNDTPIANNDSAITDENKAVSIKVTDNDSDVETGFIDGSLINIVNGPAHGAIEIQVDGKIYYTPNADYYGLDSFEYTVTDLEGLVSNVATVSIAINIVNTAPKAIDGQVITTNEDTVKTFDISDYFYDREGDAMELVSASAANGSIQISGNQISYISNHNFSGNDFITLTIKDSNGASATIVSRAVINAVNDAPEAHEDNFSLLEDSSLRLAVLDNDVDAEDVLFANNITNITAPLHGVVSINPVDGSLLYTPNSNYSGSDTFTYTITDSGGLTSNATVNINVVATNDAPIASVTTAATNEDNSIVIDVLSGASDIDAGDILTISSITNGSHGTASIVLDVNGKQVISYIPNSNYSGTDQISYTISDGNGGFVTKDLVVTVNAVNDAPIASITTATTNEDNSLTIDVLSGASDIDVGDILTISSITNGTNGTASIVLDANGKQVISYIPNSNYNGTDQISYTISDGNGGFVTKDLVVTVNAVNDAPTASITTATTNEDNSIVIDVLSGASDIDAGDILTISSITNGSHGTASIVLDVNGKQVISYIPNSNYNGTDQISYTISDGNGGFVTKDLVVTVNAVNDAPVAGPAIATQTAKFNNNFTYTIPETAFTDIDNASLTYSAKLSNGSALPSWLVFDAATKTFAGTPPSGAVTTLSIEIIASDGALSATQTFKLKVVTNVINGTSGADTINGASSNDEIYGKAGNDTINGSLGADIIDGGDGIDKVSYSGSTEAVTVNLLTNINTGGTAAGDTLISIENIVGSSYNDTLTGNSSKNTIFGGKGNDTIIGGLGADIINGGNGIDTASYADSIEAVTVNLLTNINTGGTAAGDTLTAIENIIGSSFNDNITGNGGNNTLSGGDGDDIVAGGDGSDTLNGDQGNDQLFGGNGNDILNGNEGNDTINGGNSNDLITGGKGIDVMIGGIGNDQFIFNSLEDSTDTNIDLITDFIRNKDKINLSDLDFDSITQGQGSNPSEHGLEYHFENGNTIIEDTHSNFAIKLAGEIQLGNGDFIF